jgi:hypothetical protein
MSDFKFECFKCKRNLMAKKVRHHYVAEGDGVETVCDRCYKYVYFNQNGFKKKGDEK